MRSRAFASLGLGCALLVGFGCDDPDAPDGSAAPSAGAADAAAGATAAGGTGAGAGGTAGFKPVGSGLDAAAPDAAGADAGADAGQPAGSRFESLVTGYAELERLTERPIVFVDIGLCRIPIRGFDTPVHTVTAEIDVYANGPAVAPFAQTAERTFPAGSIIVKEKRADDVLVGLGMMLKSESGWSYAYYEDDRLYEDVPELALCGQCHDSGEVPQELADAIGLDTVREPIELPTPRDSVFLTLPESDASPSGW